MGDHAQQRQDAGGIETGLLADAIPFLSIGSGPPVVQVMALTATHEVPTGMDRRMALARAKPLTSHFRVHVVNRRRGLQPGASMSDIAGDLASAIEDAIEQPVLLTGTSTGGSVALQLAVDRPDLVHALVVVAAAHRLGPRGRQVQRELARLTRQGDAAAGWAQLMAATLPSAVRAPARPLLRLMSAPMVPDDPSDLLVTIEAEDRFDVGGQLGRITAPTLVIGGGKDVFYPQDLFEQTAAGVQRGTAHINPDWGHLRTSASSDTTNLLLGFFLANRPT